MKKNEKIEKESEQKQTKQNSSLENVSIEDYSFQNEEQDENTALYYQYSNELSVSQQSTPQDVINQTNFQVWSNISSPIAKTKGKDLTEERALIGLLLTETQIGKDSISAIILKMKAEWFQIPNIRAFFEVLFILSSQNKSFDAQRLALFSQIQKTIPKAKLKDDVAIEDVIYSEIKLFKSHWHKLKRLILKDKNKDEHQSVIADYFIRTVDILKERSGVLFLQRIPKQIENLFKGNLSNKTKLQIAEQALAKAKDVSLFSLDRNKTLKEIAEERFLEYRKMAENPDRNRVTGIASQYHEFDQVISGINPQKYIIVAARPSMGKTTFVLNWLVDLARKGHHAVFFSFEMSKDEVVEKMLGIMSGLTVEMMRRGNLTAMEWQKLSNAIEELQNFPFTLFEASDILENDVNLMLAKIREIHSKNPIAVASLDYFQLLRDSTLNANAKPSERYTAISNKIQTLTRATKIPFIVISALNRDIEKRASKRPTMADLKDTSALEYDTDTIIFLHNDSYYNDDETLKNNKDTPEPIEFIFAKNRGGAKDVSVSLLFDKPKGIFMNPPELKDSPFSVTP